MSCSVRDRAHDKKRPQERFSGGRQVDRRPGEDSPTISGANSLRRDPDERMHGCVCVL